jgi:ParB family chromosome partitioning protein
MSLDNLMDKGNSISALRGEGSISAAEEIALDLIDFDPNQPRKEFDAKQIKTLGRSLQQHGQLQPISVRSNPDKAGRYIINYGECRYRAAKGIGLKTIQAVLNERFSRQSQAVENLVRAELTLMERVIFISEELAKGVKQKELALSLGRDEQWLSRHVQVIDAPEVIMDAIDSGMIQSVEVAQTLTSRWFKGDTHEVCAFLESFEDGDTATTTLLRNWFKKPVEAAQGEVKGTKKPTTERSGGEVDAEVRLVKKLRKLEPIEQNQLKELVNDKAIFGKLQLLTQGSVESMSALILYAIEHEQGDIEAIFDQLKEPK